MITGVVNAEFEPIISLSIRRSDGKLFTQDAGFAVKKFSLPLKLSVVK